jgi:hypothetical protein
MTAARNKCNRKLHAFKEWSFANQEVPRRKAAGFSSSYRDTKTKDKHNIPLPDDLIHDLKEHKRMNGDGFVFSLDGGVTPICRKTMYHDFHRALRDIGISDDEIAEWYCHFDPAEFAQAKQVQENLLRPETGKPVETVAVMPERTASGKTAKAGGNEAAGAGKTASTKRMKC